MCASVQASLEVIKTAKKHINNDLMIRSTLRQNNDSEISSEKCIRPCVCVRKGWGLTEGVSGCGVCGWLNPHVVSRSC